MTRKATGDHGVEIVPIVAAVGVAIGGAVVADQLLGIDGTIALAGISYLAYVLTYSVARRRARWRRRSTPNVHLSGVDGADSGGDLFEAFLDALYEGP